MTTRKPTELEDRVRHTEQQVGSLFGEVQRHGEILSDHSGKLDRIFQAVSSKGHFDPLRILNFIALCIVIVATLAGGITYMASSTNQAAISSNAERLSIVEFQAREIWNTGRWVPIAYRPQSAPGSVHVKTQ